MKAQQLSLLKVHGEEEVAELWDMAGVRPPMPESRLAMLRQRWRLAALHLDAPNVDLDTKVQDASSRNDGKCTANCV